MAKRKGNGPDDGLRPQDRRDIELEKIKAWTNRISILCMSATKMGPTIRRLGSGVIVVWALMELPNVPPVWKEAVMLLFDRWGWAMACTGGAVAGGAYYYNTMANRRRLSSQNQRTKALEKGHDPGRTSSGLPEDGDDRSEEEDET